LRGKRKINEKGVVQSPKEEKNYITVSGRGKHKMLAKISQKSQLK